MRARTIALIIFVLLLAAFVALNLSEFTRVAVLNLGIAVVALPLGLVMLLLLGVVALGFLAWTLYVQRTSLLETRQYARELSVQRDLADKAEASRFTDLRHYLEMQTAAAQSRETATEQVMSERLAQQNRPVMERLDQLENTMAAYLGQLEDRLERPGGSLSSSPDGLGSVSGAAGSTGVVVSDRTTPRATVLTRSG